MKTETRLAATLPTLVLMACTILQATGAGASSPNVPSEAEQTLAQGDAYYGRAAYLEAIHSYEQAALDPAARYRAQLGMARSFSAIGRPDAGIEAATEAEAAASSDEERAIALNLRGILWSKLPTRVSPVVDPLERARDPEKAQLLAFKNAVADFAAALDAGADPTRVLLNLATAQARAHAYADSGESLARLLELDPSAETRTGELRAHLGCLEKSVGAENLERFTERPNAEPLRVVKRALPRDEIPPGMLLMLSGVVDAKGRLHCARATYNRGASAEYVSAVTRSLSRWRFRAATLDGEPTAAPFTLTIARP